MTGSKIFICYRRDDSAPYAGRLCGDLRKRFQHREVFMDLEIELGGQFDKLIESELSSCAAVLVVIGPDWLNAAEEDGSRRLDNPEDYVRREIAIALQRSDVVVIPLLVRRTPMPRASQLPEPLVGLAGRRGLEIRDERWEDDVEFVARRLERVLNEQPEEVVPAIAPVQGAGPGPYGPWVRNLALGILAIALVAVVAVILAASGGSPKRPMVKIGAIFALSGAARQANKEAVEGLQFAVDYINDGKDPGSTLPLQAGDGLPHRDGAKLKLVVADAGRQRCTVERAFNRLVDNDRVAAVVGANESTVTLRAIIAADRRGVPLVNAGSNATNLTPPSHTRGKTVTTCHTVQDDPRPSPWFFRVGPNDTQTAEQFFAQLNASHLLSGVSKIAILQESNDIFGNGGATELEAAAARQGIAARRFKYPTVVETTVDVTDDTCADDEREMVKAVRSAVDQVKHYEPQIVFAVSYLPDATTIVQRMSELKLEPQAMLVSGSSYLSDGFVKGVREGNRACGHGLAPGVRDDPTGIIAQASWATGLRDPSANAKRVEALFEQRFHRPMSVRTAGGFTAGMTLAQAIDTARSTSPADIRDALKSLDVPADRTIMPWDGIRFDASGQNTRSANVLEQYLDGRYRVVYPDDKATQPAIFPLSLARR